MLMVIVVILVSLVVLVWSADLFVEGAAGTARHFNIPPLMIGMVVIGFGTSAPELVVSTLASWQGNPNIALGNAYGSNISNIALILGVTALISPIVVHSSVLRKELPILVGATGLTAVLLLDNQLNRMDAVILLTLFSFVMGWTIWQGLRQTDDTLKLDLEKELSGRERPLGKSIFRLMAGLILLVLSSRGLVWGAVDIAQRFGVSDLIIGLTVIAIGTSLPELASSVVAARKGEHDLALGNVLGSNLFNTLAVVGIAGLIMPTPVMREVLVRDVTVMGGLTLSLFVIGYGFRRPGRINRFEGTALLTCFVAYTLYLVSGAASN